MLEIMEREEQMLALVITAIAVVAILLVTFIWPGPARPSLVSDDMSHFDERLVWEVYAKVSPAVVAIYSYRESGDSYTEVSSGSGFLIDKEGHIVSNHHVVQASDRVRISFSDYRSAEAVAQVRNSANDLVLLKADPALVADIEPVELGDSSLVRPGQMVINLWC